MYRAHALVQLDELVRKPEEDHTRVWVQTSDELLLVFHALHVDQHDGRAEVTRLADLRLDVLLGRHRDVVDTGAALETLQDRGDVPAGGVLRARVDDAPGGRGKGVLFQRIRGADEIFLLGRIAG